MDYRTNKLPFFSPRGEMIKRVLKTVLKKAMMIARSYVQLWEEEERQKAPARYNYDQDGYAYPWLNYLFTKLMTIQYCNQRPAYAWGVLHGTYLAKVIGMKHISVIEFGIAGGNGLISLERIAENVEDMLGIGIEVYGFDTGVGLPKPKDYRDLPNLYKEAAFSMDVEKLKQRLRRAQPILGLVGDTLKKFIESRPPPVAFISFDLDYYSSTWQAFKLLESDQALLLPRIHCYFDDIMGFTFSEFTGERLAISEFNETHTARKISQIYGLRYFLPSSCAQEQWSEMMYLAHIFDHQLYTHNDGLLKVKHYADITDLR